MMKDKKKIPQPFRTPGEYGCYLEGVKAVADVFGYKVDAMAWGGGIPIDLHLYLPEDEPEPVLAVEIDPNENDDKNAESDAGT